MQETLDFVLAGGGAKFSPRSPCVVALCASFPEGGGEALRAELRGLGAEMVVLTPRSGVWLSPDGEPRALLPAPKIWREHRVRPPERGGSPLTVLVFDEHRRLRLRRDADAQIPVEATLLSAVREARKRSGGVGRRDLLAGTLVSALGFALAQACAAVRTRDLPAPEPEGNPQTLIDVALIVNGEKRPLRLEPRVTLLDALRENLQLTGSKKGCDMGQCGACTVLIDGMRVNSCLQLAATHDGHKITTIEGLADGERLHPMQQAFIDCDGFQCGYCTPGQILSAVALLKEGRPADDEAIREGMSGNLCRCGAYPGILAAIAQVRG